MLIQEHVVLDQITFTVDLSYNRIVMYKMQVQEKL